MDKRPLIDAASIKLRELGVSFTQGEGTDIKISTEFLNASFSSGKKTINYDALVYFDEVSATVFMWELTKEKSSGFSFGASSESFVQSGSTLSRKVKSVQYGPDGKAYEYSLDLGAINKTFKDIAKINGWKFKIVLKKQKASYPNAYGQSVQPAAPVTPMPKVDPIAVPPQRVQQQYNDPKASFYAKGQQISPSQKPGVLFWVIYIIIGLITVTLLLGGKCNVIGWVICLGVYIMIYFANKSLAGKVGLKILVWVISIIVILFALALTMDINTKENSKESAVVQTLRL